MNSLLPYVSLMFSLFLNVWWCFLCSCIFSCLAVSLVSCVLVWCCCLSFAVCCCADCILVDVLELVRCTPIHIHPSHYSEAECFVVYVPLCVTMSFFFFCGREYSFVRV